MKQNYYLIIYIDINKFLSKLKMKKSKNKFNKISTSQVWDAENIFHLKTNVSRISQILYHYELYKLILNVPGCVIECGVFKGNSLVRFLTYRSLLENNFSREFYGFDVFVNFQQLQKKVIRSL